MGCYDYLSDEEQYREILNYEEVKRIQDPELRRIRLKYWNLFHDAFLNEQRISDSTLEKECDKIKTEEKKELDEYRWLNNKG